MSIDFFTKNNKFMGLIHANVVLKNGEDLLDVRRKRLTSDKVRSKEVKVLVGSVTIMLAINETIKSQLGLEAYEKDFIELADGSSVELDIVGPIEVRFSNRRSITDAFVLPGDSEPLLGTISLDAMDLKIDSERNELIVNPLHPNRPQFSMKRFKKR